MAKTTDKGQNKNNDVINKKEEPAKEASLKAAADDIKNLEQEMQDIEDKAQSLRAQEETAAQQDNQKQQTEEKEQPKDEQKAAETAEPVNTYSDSRVDYDPYYDQAKQISDLNQKIKSLKGSNFILTSLSVVIFIGLAAFSIYSVKTTDVLRAKDNMLEAQQQEILNAKNLLQDSAQSLSSASEQINLLLKRNGELEDALNSYKVLDGKVTSVESAGKTNASDIASLSARLKRYEAQNPDDWRLAECYFLVNNAMQKAVFDKDVKAALWFLNNANLLIADIEDTDVIAIREAINADITTLSNLKPIDRYGINIALNEVYKNIDNLVLKGFSDADMRKDAFQKETTPTDSILNWKDNILNSAKEFSSRFIEVRRKDPKETDAFLSPTQEAYLRENIKTRILLAKADLNYSDAQDYAFNLNDALSLVKAYFDNDHQVTKTVINDINELLQKSVDLDTPTVLSSSALFNKFAKERILEPIDVVNRGEQQ
ncbi:uroporphyrinogen-III C-methyltransferase [uncultured Succinatimonas sp.]|uniref:uroporphyrinogen-III C-methyltransferase n=1 Tax=uncultured Succinatimonas sp. TaxID=1262973 RepID=UPI0025FE3CC4|nr:uroporphyrinogen-III C-methyltransferase [uncultured Succinatimonas sp.]